MLREAAPLRLLINIIYLLDKMCSTTFSICANMPPVRVYKRDNFCLKSRQSYAWYLHIPSNSLEFSRTIFAHLPWAKSFVLLSARHLEGFNSRNSPHLYSAKERTNFTFSRKSSRRSKNTKKKNYVKRNTEKV